MKPLIEKLIAATQQMPFTISSMADILMCAQELQAALDSGALDCLVEHPASEPPKGGIRDVLVLTIHGHYAIDYYHTLDKGFRHCGNLARTWRELPKGTK